MPANVERVKRDGTLAFGLLCGGQLLWSGLRDYGADSNYTQQLGGHSYTLRLRGDRFEGSLDGARQLFACSAGVRVVTDLDGQVTEMWGIDTVARQAELNITGSVPIRVTINPNEVWRIDGVTASRLRAAPYVAPFF